MWGVGLNALNSITSDSHTAGGRTERGTLGVLTFVGFVLTVVGVIRWWRARVSDRRDSGQERT